MASLFHTTLCFCFCFLTTLFTLIPSSHAYTFHVGGKEGWTLHPSESYNHWAGRLRFLINDTLHFKYDGSSDSVLIVNKGDYDTCNANSPIKSLTGGDSTFKFDRSGPFYFITGNKSNCDQGQKLIVVVLALRIRSPPPSIVTPAVSPVLPPSPSPLSVSPVSPPSGTPVLTPPPRASSPGGGIAPSGGGGNPLPGSPSAETTSPPSSSTATTRPCSGGIIATGVHVTVGFVLWRIYY